MKQLEAKLKIMEEEQQKRQQQQMQAAGGHGGGQAILEKQVIRQCDWLETLPNSSIANASSLFVLVAAINKGEAGRGSTNRRLRSPE